MYTFHIPKMSCGGCINNIKNAIKKVDDEAIIEADLATKMIKVETDMPIENIAKTLTDARYAPN